MEKTDKSAEDYWFEYSHESIVEGLRGITEANFKAAIRACQKDSAVQQLSEYKEYFELSEKAKQVLRDKGYGWTGLDILETCKLVPKAEIPEEDQQPQSPE